MNAKKLAEGLVALLLAKRDIRTWTDKDLRTVVMGILKAAGFNVDKIERRPYKPESEYGMYEQHLNGWFPFTAVGESDVRDTYQPTLWFNYLVFNLLCRDESPGFCRHGWATRRPPETGTEKKEAIAMILREVRRSQPLAPIQITGEGDLAIEPIPYQPEPGNPFSTQHLRDADKITESMLAHKDCGGDCCARPIGDSLVLSCDACNLRVKMPRTVKTFGQMRAHFAERFRPAPALQAA